MKILAIDDKEDNLISLTALINSFLPECTVLTAMSGAKGLEKAEKEMPDTIILDIKMPSMDGFETLEWFKHSLLLQNIPIIMLTAVSTDSESRVRSLELGADAFLTKPIEPSELIAQIKVMMRIKKNEDLLRQEKYLLDDMVREGIKSLQESEERYQQIFETVATSIVVVDREGLIVDINRHHLESIGKKDETKEDYLDQSILTHSSIVNAGLASLYENVLEGEKISMKAVYFPNLAEGIDGWFNIRGVPLHEDGEVSGAVFVHEDITELKNSEESKALIEKKLNQAQKMEAIGTLAGGIAHDFNNILGAILGYSTMAKEGLNSDSRPCKDVQKVIDAGLRAKSLVKQILAFSRQAGQEIIPLKIQYLAKEVLKLLRATMPSTIQINQSISASCGPVLADPTQIHQIILNLCTNANHAMLNNGGVLSVSLETIEILENAHDVDNLDISQGTYVKLEVSDTGHGMSPKVLDRIFDPFFTTKELGEGTGLGLAVAHGIVKSYSGFIQVSSELKKGTTFSIYLPQIDSEIKPEDALDMHMPRGTETILIVDDEMDLAEMMERMLSDLGYSVNCFIDSQAALQEFKSQPDRYELVVTDMTMPKMTGADMAEKMLTIRPDISIILCTGYSSLIDEESAISLGMKGYLPKPVIKKKLADLVRKVLDDKN